MHLLLLHLIPVYFEHPILVLKYKHWLFRKNLSQILLRLRRVLNSVAILPVSLASFANHSQFFLYHLLVLRFLPMLQLISLRRYRFLKLIISFKWWFQFPSVTSFSFAATAAYTIFTSQCLLHRQRSIISTTFSSIFFRNLSSVSWIFSLILQIVTYELLILVWHFSR